MPLHLGKFRRRLFSVLIVSILVPLRFINISFWCFSIFSLNVEEVTYKKTFDDKKLQQNVS